MLNLFKKKTPISEVFPIDFVDIHSHLLPGIDDGAKTIEDSISLISKMEEYGIRKFVTTPHVLGSVWPNSSDTILDKLDLVQEELEKRNMSHIQIDAAAEYMLDEQFCELLKKRDLLTIREDSLLVEMSYFNAPVNLFEILFDIQLAGYNPILAHPERYNFYHKKFDVYEKLKNAGCRFQLNILSLTGYYGDHVKKAAEKLIELNMIDFVGTDTHHHKHLEAMNNLGTKKILKQLQPLLKNNQLFV
ncbi:tyrosine-protein phosphatase [Flavicella sediminum]|uniref:tyrosine-protein phosphatase n=1 Tax=Flavicella sediminum TaxID=2585141 RepID=UPI0011206F9E|nr:CpsB/CapC family capsule biosynthesis tyrosine phosphatase [Flavicella sediminum]